MKTMTVVLTEEEAERVESAARDQGVTPDDVLHDAVSAYLSEVLPQDVNEGDVRPDLWFIGIGSSRDHKPLTSEPPATDMDEEMRGVEPRAHENQLWFIPKPQGAPLTSDIASRFDEALAESFTRFLLEEEVSSSPEKEPDSRSDHSERGDDDCEKGA